MSRPIKQGLDYFPMDVDCDDKLELIEAKHGIAGFGVVIKLFQKIYKEGYYLNWNEETTLLFSKRINVNINDINVIIKDCFYYNILDKKLYSDYKILTSSGIQKRYLNAIDRRKEITLCKNYIIVDIKRIKVNIIWIKHDNNTQSKVKESKVKESKVKESKYLPDKPADFIDQIVNCFIQEHGSYEIVTPGKERKMAGKILRIYKKKYPDTNSEETLAGLKTYFKMCVNIQDSWLRNNMSLSIIVNKFNEINKILKNGTNKNDGATREQLTELLAGKLGITE